MHTWLSCELSGHSARLTRVDERLYYTVLIFCGLISKDIKMAETIVALGIAANVIGFVEFGVRTISTFWRFVRSGADTNTAVPDVESTTRDLQKLLENIQSSSASSNDASEDERDLYQLAEDCQNVARDILGLLSKISLPDQSRKRDALRAACKTVFREDEVKSLQARLELFRSQLTLHLLASLR